MLAPIFPGRISVRFFVTHPMQIMMRCDLAPCLTTICLLIWTRYFSPQEHHVPRTLEQLYSKNDLELFDLSTDPLEMRNLAIDRSKYGDLLLAMNKKLNLLIESEVGEDIGQMLPGGADGNWQLSPDIQQLRM